MTARRDAAATDDAALVARSMRGDRAAFADLIERHASAMLTTAWRILGDRAMAEDAVQDAFLAAFRGLPNFRADARFSTWLYRIVVNKCRDALRARSSARETSTTTTGDEGDAFDLDATPVGGKTPEEQLIDKERGKQLVEALGELSPLYREAFVLRHVDGLSYEEMADVLDVDGSTLRMRVYKARQELGRALAGLAVR